MKKLFNVLLAASMLASFTAVPFVANADATSFNLIQENERSYEDSKTTDMDVIEQKVKDFVEEKGYNATVKAFKENVLITFKQQAVGEKDYDTTAITQEIKTFCENNSVDPSLVQVIFLVDDSTIKDLGVFEEGEMMTLKDVIELSKKGNALTLNDFVKFKGVIAGSGIFILEYDLGKGYTLTVGSVALDKIDYARLRYSGSENYIDIRTDDVEKYLSTSAEESNIKGDANCDGVMNLADAVLIMQSILNPDKYKLTEQGRQNADIAGNNDGVTNSDALAIQRKLLNLE